MPSKIKVVQSRLLAVTCLIALLTLLFSGVAQAEPDFSSNYFQANWQRADKAVAEAAASPARSWLWGPESFNAPTSNSTEPYQESPGGRRQVQYFDKARMELNNPATGQVTNGLLVRELISGRQTLGDSAVIQRRVADIPIAGDPSGNIGPTYASFARIASLNNDNPVSNRVGQPVTDTIDQSGSTGTASAMSSKATYVYYEANLKHNIPDVFWAFLNQRGNVYENSRYLTDQPVLGSNPLAPWVEALGWPITEAYWARVTVAGQVKDVLIQAFERRVLTYTPSNPVAFQVEMGNVGRHYYSWRYDNKYDIKYEVASPHPAMTGINLSGAEFASHVLPGNYGSDYAYPTHAEADYFASKGMNIFRVPLLWERLQPQMAGELNPQELYYLDDFVNYATSKGVKVLLDLHNYARYYGKTVGASEVTAQVFADFWGKMAARYKNNSLVAFGLMNEPGMIKVETWVGDANAAIQAIRATGATNLILVAGSNPTNSYSWNQIWSGTAFGKAMLSVADPANNYAYEFHQYLDKDSSGTSEKCVSRTIGSERLRDFTNWLKQNRQRGFLGEFGGGRNETCYAALDDMLSFVDNNREVWIGWTYWAAGPLWPKDYIYTLEPDNGLDQPQLAVLSKHLYGTTAPATAPASAAPASTPPPANLPASAPASYKVQYEVPGHWDTGYNISVNVVNSGDSAVKGWTISWQLSYNETLTSSWNASCSVAGSTITCTSLPYNGEISPKGGLQNFGAQFSTKGGNYSQPSSFSVNGVTVNK